MLDLSIENEIDFIHGIDQWPSIEWTLELQIGLQTMWRSKT